MTARGPYYVKAGCLIISQLLYIAFVRFKTRNHSHSLNEKSSDTALC